MDFRDELIALLPRLRRFAAGLCGELALADDLVQEACSRAIAHQHKWQPGTRLDSWMFRIIQNLHRDQLRAANVRNRHADETGWQAESAIDGAREMDSRTDLGIVQAGILQLPEDQRAVLLMVCVDGLSYRETADSLQIPVGTVMSRLSRARLRLHEILHGDDTPRTPPATETAR